MAGTTRILVILMAALALAIAAGCSDDSNITGGTLILGGDEGELPPAPTISDVTAGAAGEQVTITGTNFSPTAASNVVAFYPGQGATVSSATSSALSVILPDDGCTGPMSVTVNFQTVDHDYDGFAPVIKSVVPASATTGEQVAIFGTGFNTVTRDGNAVTFAGETATVTAADVVAGDNSLTVTVPANVPNGPVEIRIVVTSQGVTSPETSEGTLFTKI